MTSRRISRSIETWQNSYLEHMRASENHATAHSNQNQRQQQQQQQRRPSTMPRGKTGALRVELSFDDIPLLFRCRTDREIRKVLDAGKGSITDIYQGYNALQWYCDAKSTSPTIISVLINLGIDINAVDQRAIPHGAPVIRHTALGYACRNANVKAVCMLLRHGADPRGLRSRRADGDSSAAKPKNHDDKNKNKTKNDNTDVIIYPSPLQELLCQDMHGPHPGKHAWTYHLSEEDEEKDAYLDDEEEDALPEFRSLVGVMMIRTTTTTTMSNHLPSTFPHEDDNNNNNNNNKNEQERKNNKTERREMERREMERKKMELERREMQIPHDRTWCAECAADYHIFEPWPTSEEEEIGARERRRARYFMQVERAGRRFLACAQLLVDYHCYTDAPHLSDGDDPRLWGALDCFLQTTWRFLGPLAVCWREENGQDRDRVLRRDKDGDGDGDGDEGPKTLIGKFGNIPSMAAFPPFGDLCDLLVESAGYSISVSDNREGEVDAALAVANGQTGHGTTPHRGWHRLVAAIAQHPRLEKFGQGDFFDVDEQLRLCLPDGY